MPKIPKEMFEFFEAAFFVMLLLTIIYVSMLFFAQKVYIDNEDIFKTLNDPIPGYNCKKDTNADRR